MDAKVRSFRLTGEGEVVIGEEVGVGGDLWNVRGGGISYEGNYVKLGGRRCLYLRLFW